MTNLLGDVVAVWEGPENDSTVVNETTQYLADGSDIAKRTRPGLMYTLDAELVLIRELDKHGRAIQGVSGTLVANHDVIDGDDVALIAGEALPVTAVIIQGVLKNPGPEYINVQVTYGAEVATLSIHPGDGIFVGQPDEGDLERLGLSVQCICTCTSDTSPIAFRAIALPCIHVPEDGQFEPFDHCECEPWNDGACIVDNRQGTLSGCRAGVASSSLN